jgi:hypothetical protein
MESRLMKAPDLNRRDFTRWTAAAFGGVVAGSMVGCGDAPAPDSAQPGSADEAAPEGSDSTGAEGSGAASTADGDVTYDVAYLTEEPHVCRGLNTCQGKGAGGENACAGQGACATANEHTCHYHNECKGQGGCGENPGQNSCKGHGECAVPLSNATWEKARAAFEKAMTDAGKTVGDAPAATE